MSADVGQAIPKKLKFHSPYSRLVLNGCGSLQGRLRDKLPESTRMVGRLNNRSNERYVNEQEGIGKAVKRVGQSIGVSGEGVCHGEMSHVCSVPTFYGILA